MNEKPRLNIDDLEVESFHTTDGSTGAGGTVFAFDTELTTCQITQTCGANETCQNPCQTDWGVCTGGGECTAEACGGGGTVYTESGCTNDTPNLNCLSLAAQCDTYNGYTCSFGEYCYTVPAQTC